MSGQVKLITFQPVLASFVECGVRLKPLTFKKICELSESVQVGLVFLESLFFS